MTKTKPSELPHTPVLDEGFVRMVDTMGNDAAIVQAARVSYGEGTKTPSDDETLIRYLMRHWHTSPFEMCEAKFHVKCPISVARQWVRHRTGSFNEVSSRYSVVTGDFYLPEMTNIRHQSKTNKQGRGGQHELAYAMQEVMIIVADDAHGKYKTLLDADVARETARDILPLCTYTEFYWKVDLHNLFHFLRLRTDLHAQWEIRQYAQAIERMVAGWVPVAYQAWVDYQRDAVTFSRMEMELVREMVQGAAYPTSVDLSKREQEEFWKKLVR